MELPLGIKQLPYKKFTNAHDNFTQHFSDNNFFAVSIGDPEFINRFPTFTDKYRQTTKNFQWLIGYAIEKDIRLRAVGSGWSFSKAAVSSGGIIDTKNLRLRARLLDNMVVAEYRAAGNDSENLLLVQCGNTVLSLNDLLEKRSDPKKSIKASGGSNGQTIVGAFSTGTHGAAFRFGGLAEFIVGIHMITGPNSHVWLERESKPVTSKEFREKLNVELLADDEVFYSALVSFGSFGIIHSVLLEIEPIYYLEQESRRFKWDSSLEKALCQGDFSEIELNLPYPVDTPANPLYHWEVVINPHDFKKNNDEKGVYLRTMYKFKERGQLPVKDPKNFTYGDDLLGVMQTMLDSLEALSGGLTNKLLVPGLVNALFKTAYDRPEKAIGTIGETFGSTIFRGKLFSAAFGLDRASIVKVIEIILSINSSLPFAGAAALRFVKGTKAVLGFTRFENTCVLELDGVDATVNHKFLQKVADTFDSEGITFTMHWGKINTVMTAERLKNAYGDKAVNTWLKSRGRILSPAVQQVFTNQFMERLGLDVVINDLIV